jgi:hypothetical protein
MGMTDQSTTTARSGGVPWWLGFVVHLLILPWFASTGLVAPGWAVAVLLAAWVVLLLVGLRLRTTRPLWMLAIPVLDVLVWFVLISAGDRWLGWTA